MAAAIAGCLGLGCWAATKRDKAEGPPPAVRIETEALGYHPLSSFYVLSRLSSVSLDFIDRERVLFTFRTPGLLKRLPDCRAGDDDQLIRALVLHLPDGKIERSAEWRMHDRARYLWALGNGQFLVRQQDSLLVTDAALELRPFVQASTPLRSIKVSPGGRLLLIEHDLEKHTPDQHRQLWDAAQAQGSSPPREDIQLNVLRVQDRSVLLRARSLNTADLPMIADGYLEMLPAKGNHWMLRYRPFSGEATVVADVISACRPSEIPVNDQIAVVSTCPERGDDHVFEAISLTGKRSWSYRWDSRSIWPTTAVSEDGSRIAFSTLRVAHAVTAREPIDEEELQAQRVEVVDVESGQMLLAQNATPVLSGGQNYALSPDGRRFAILRNAAIEIYELPTAAPPAPSGK